jgi:3-oxoadipate enol-lactonase
VRQQGVAAIAEAVLPKLLGRTTHAERPRVVELVRGMILAASSRGVVDALAGLAARADSTGSLRDIRVPTLVVCGEEDELTPPADAGTLVQGIRGAELALVPRAGHLSNLEAPAEFGAALRAFLDRSA